MKLFQRRQNRAALRMSQNHHEPRSESRCGELDAPDLRRRNNVACNPNDEQIAEPLIEYHLGRNSRVGATEYDCHWLLYLRELRSFGLVQEDLVAGNVGGKALVSFLESRKGFSSSNH